MLLATVLAADIAMNGWGSATRYPCYLPGRTPARAGVLTLIILAVAAALWFYVFPWASLHLPIDSSGFTG